MSPGKWSRAQTVPNKPAVCHKAPLVPWPVGMVPWARPANIFFKWEGDASLAFPQRSWAVPMRPSQTTQQHFATGTADPYSFEILVTHKLDPPRYDFVAKVFSDLLAFLVAAEANRSYQAASPWDTGLVVMVPNLTTASASFEAMA